jgi:hypothetical protein
MSESNNNSSSTFHEQVHNFKEGDMEKLKELNAVVRLPGDRRWLDRLEEIHTSECEILDEEECQRNVEFRKTRRLT